MNIFVAAFNTILYQPLFNLLVLLYLYLPGHDFGIAVIALTILIKLILYPLTMRGIKSQKAFQEIQPKLKEIQEKYKTDKQKQAKAMMELYQKEKINPFSGCLPLLIQLPILIAVYRVFWRGLGPAEMQYLYSFLPNPGQINPSFLGIIDLSKPYWILALICGISQYFQTKMLSPKNQPVKSQKGTSDFSQIMQKQMHYFFPAFTVLILLKLPSALALYWLFSTLLTILEQYLVSKKHALKR